MSKSTTMAVAACWLALAGTVQAAPDASKLGTVLTATGAEKGGNADGTIPAWAGGDKEPAGWSAGKPRAEFSPYTKDAPLFTITAANVGQYAARLSAGQVAMLKQNDGYAMKVYPSHRSCGLPDFVQENTKATVGRSAIGADGWSLTGTILPSVPFAMPENGIQAIWNHLARYYGVGVKFDGGASVVSPRPGSSDWLFYRGEQLFYMPWAAKGQHMLSGPTDLITGVYYQYREPAALVGQAFMGRNYFVADGESFYYFSGQRRVRRLPSYAYDAPTIGFENQYPVDAYAIFNGLPDRFDWELKGKQELYVPYNSFALLSTDAKVEDVFQPLHVSNDMRRYELHRVWHVQGKVKEGMRHTSPTKDIYLDEDGWMALVGDDYDAAGKIWRLKENYSVPIWEIGACTLAAYVSNDLASGRYVADGTMVGGNPTVYMADESEDPRLKDNFFTVDNLRAISGR